MAWTTGFGPLFDILLVGAFAGLVGTLAMSAIEFPVYRPRGVRGVPDYELNLEVTFGVRPRKPLSLGTGIGGGHRPVKLSLVESEYMARMEYNEP